MRIWSIHPQYLDPKGLVAVWRETLLAQKVLAGRTRGYRNHPQLDRFKSLTDPVAAVAAYLHSIADEADRRQYHFDRSRILTEPTNITLSVTDGQLRYEWNHLLAKLAARDPERHALLLTGVVTLPTPHPIFEIVTGDVEPWEKH